MSAKKIVCETPTPTPDAPAPTMTGAIAAVTTAGIDFAAIALDEADLLGATALSKPPALRKAGKDEWFQVSTEARHKPMIFSVYQATFGSKGAYLVTGAAAKNVVVQQVCRSKLIYVAVNRDGETFLSAVNAASDDPWSASSRVGHEAAKRGWVRLVANQPASRYDVPSSSFADVPAFPADDYNTLLGLALGGMIISDVDHPVARTLLGLPPL